MEAVQQRGPINGDLQTAAHYPVRRTAAGVVRRNIRTAVIDRAQSRKDPDYPVPLTAQKCARPQSQLATEEETFACCSAPLEA